MHKKFITLATVAALTVSVFSTGVYASNTNNSLPAQTSVPGYSAVNLESIVNGNTNLSLAEDSELLSANEYINSLKKQTDLLDNIWAGAEDDTDKTDISAQIADNNNKMTEKLASVKDIVAKAQTYEYFGLDLNNVLSQGTNLSLDERSKLLTANYEIEQLKAQINGLEKLWGSDAEDSSDSDYEKQAEDLNTQINEKYTSVKDIVAKVKGSEYYGVDLDELLSDSTNLSLDEVNELTLVNNEVKSLKDQLNVLQDVWNYADDDTAQADIVAQAEDINNQINDKLASIKDIVVEAKSSENFGVNLDKIISENINLSPDDVNKLTAVNSEIKSLKDQLNAYKDIWTTADGDSDKLDAAAHAKDATTQINEKLSSIKDIIARAQL